MGLCGSGATCGDPPDVPYGWELLGRLAAEGRTQLGLVGLLLLLFLLLDKLLLVVHGEG